MLLYLAVHCQHRQTGKESQKKREKSTPVGNWGVAQNRHTSFVAWGCQYSSYQCSETKLVLLKKKYLKNKNWPGLFILAFFEGRRYIIIMRFNVITL
jgi:hypothetical protein